MILPLFKQSSIRSTNPPLLLLHTMSNNTPSQFAGCKIIFFDAGTYFVTNTITIPAGSRVVGEAWSVIMGGGDKFKDMLNPEVMIRVGERGEKGIVEITDIIFSTQGSGE